MQIFTTSDILGAAWHALSMIFEIRGAFAEAILKEVLLPFHEFSIMSILIAGVWLYIHLRNKGLIISELSHMFHVFEWVVGAFRKA